jgi:hypothetical protein
MKYITPQITNVLKADSTIQADVKNGMPTDSPELLPSAGIGYTADE